MMLKDRTTSLPIKYKYTNLQLVFETGLHSHATASRRLGAMLVRVTPTPHHCTLPLQPGRPVIVYSSLSFLPEWHAAHHPARQHVCQLRTSICAGHPALASCKAQCQLSGAPASCRTAQPAGSARWSQRPPGLRFPHKGKFGKSGMQSKVGELRNDFTVRFG